MFMFNIWIRLMIETFLELFLSGFLNVFAFNTNSTFDILSSSTGALCLLLFTGFYIFSFVILIGNQSKIGDPTFDKKYNSLYNEFK